MGDADVASASDATVTAVGPVMAVVSRVLSVPDAVDFGVETAVGTGGVLHHTRSAIGFFQLVLTSHVFAVSVLNLRFFIARVAVLDAILEFVEHWTLMESVFWEMTIINIETV